jgi:hypothetical protein
MRLITLISLGLAVAAMAVGTATATSKAGRNGFFKTQNGQIYCGWGTGTNGFVVCGIKNGYLKPKPKNNCKKQHVDYVGNRIAMGNRTKAAVQACAGDAGPFADPKATKVLKAGKTWRGGAFKCTVTTSSVTCKNRARHGFTMTTLGPYKRF